MSLLDDSHDSPKPMKSKIDNAIEALTSQGHSVRAYDREGQFWCEIDGRLLASQQEMEALADRVYSLLKPEGLFNRQRKQEQSN